jgi:hypothetical protein
MDVLLMFLETRIAAEFQPSPIDVVDDVVDLVSKESAWRQKTDIGARLL